MVTMFNSGLESLSTLMKIPITSELASAIPASIQSTLGGGNIHMIAVGRVDATLFRPVRTLASIHLRLSNRQGRVLVYGLKPWTPGFVLADTSATGPYDLLRIV